MSTYITIERAKLEQALEALKGNTTNLLIDPEQAAMEDQAIIVIEQALAAPVQEPVAWMQSDEVHISLWQDDCHTIPLYTTPPPPAAPVPLTDDVVQKIISRLEPLLDAKNQSWAEAGRMLHALTKGGAA